jgi:anti-sigma factor RsiW
MRRHLDDQELAAVLAGSAGPAADASAHLESCARCREQVAALRELVAERRAALAREAPDWERQRREVLGRLPAAGATPWRPLRRLRPLLAAAAAVLAAVALSTLWTPGPATAPADRSEIGVEEILAEVDALLADDRLPGFEAIDPGLDSPENLVANGSS